MSTELRTTDVVKTGLSITIIVIGMLFPVIIIAWAAKWIYKSKR